jgi:uncharacterized protein (TIGR03083 family)
MASPIERVKLLQHESERLKRYLNALPPEAWNRPSSCAGWEVRDVVAHLVLQAEVFTEWVYRGLQGDASAPEGLPDAGTVNAGSMSEVLAKMSVDRRQSLGDQLLSTFSSTSDQFNQLLAGARPSDWDKPCYHVFGTIPLRAFIDDRITELALHRWDIRSSLESEVHLSHGSLPAIMDWIPGTVGWVFRSGPRLPVPVRYRFEVTGPATSRSDLIVEGDRANMEPSGIAKANATFHCDAETFVLMMCGRLTPDSAVADGRMSVEGDRGLIAKFGKWFQGM